MKTRKKIGKVYLVGAGPGDIGLITVRGRDYLRWADVIVVDALVNPSLLRSAKARIVYVGKRGPGAPQGSSVHLPQKAINQLLIREAKKGFRVVRLKGGDPIVFGRGSEEMEALKKAKIPYEVVPGISSPIAVPAFAGIPVSDRRWSSQVTFLTGQEGHHRENEYKRVNWKSLPVGGTLVILMGVSRWPVIQKRLLALGWPKKMNVAAIESGTTHLQRVHSTSLGQSVREFNKRKLRAPAIIVVGQVVKLSKTLSWVNQEKPLLGRKIVVTRAEFQASSLQQKLEEKGAEVILCPTILIRPNLEYPQIKQFLSGFRKNPTEFDWVVFLSANAVRIFAQGLREAGKSSRPFVFGSSKKFPSICSVGPQTSQTLRDLGWPIAREAKRFNALSVIRSLKKVSGKRVLIPRVEKGPRDILFAFMKKGARVKELGIYRNQLAPPPTLPIKKALLQGVDAITFTSASTVRNFFEIFSSREVKTIFKKAKPVAIGPSTLQVLLKKGQKNPLKAVQATTDQLVEVLCRKIGTK